MTVPINASQHLIKAVTVFSSRKAEVVRTFSVEIAEGQNELSITSLPSCMDTDSARVTGLGDAVLFDVVCTIDDGTDTDSVDSVALDALKRQRTLLEGEKELKSKVSGILEQYGRTLSAQHATPNTVVGFLDSLSQRGASTLKEVGILDEKIQVLDKEIAKELRRIQKESQKAATRGRVSAVIMAKRAGTVEISLTYMVSNATWSPSYDLRATTEDGKPSGTVSLHYRASIQQNTGEDWRDTAVTVSTATPGSWSTIPGLRAMKISPAMSQFLAKKTKQAAPQYNAAVSFGAQRSQALHAPPPPPPAPAAAGFRAGGGSPFRSTPFGAAAAAPAVSFQADAPGDSWDVADIDDEDEEEVEEARGAWTETKAVVTESAVSSSFRIEGTCTIPSEPTAHKVAIAILSFAATVNYITVPRSTPMAFLQCEVKNTSEYRLLPGSVNVFLDNSPVSKSTIKDVNREEVFKCTLGPDPSLRVKFMRLPRTVTSSGSAYAAQTTVTTYKFCTTIQNTHSFPVEGIQVQDAAPNVGQSPSGIKVVIKHPEGLGEASPGTLVNVPLAGPLPSDARTVKVKWVDHWGEKEGKYIWVVDLAAGAEAKLEAEYEIRVPADFTWQLEEDFYN